MIRGKRQLAELGFYLALKWNAPKEPQTKAPRRRFSSEFFMQVCCLATFQRASATCRKTSPKISVYPPAPKGGILRYLTAWNHRPDLPIPGKRSTARCQSASRRSRCRASMAGEKVVSHRHRRESSSRLSHTTPRPGRPDRPAPRAVVSGWRGAAPPGPGYPPGTA